MSKAKTYKMTSLERRVERWFEWPMIFVTLLLIFTLLMPLLFELPPFWIETFAIANLIIWLAFYVELGFKFAVSANWKETLKRNWFLCIIAISPLFLSFRLIYLSRLVGLTRVLGLQKLVNKLNQQVRRLVHSVEYILLTLAIFIVISAFVMWQVGSRFGGAIVTLPDALWWSVVTVTTIGYGDIIPLSLEGRVVGAIIALMGVVLFMVFVAKVTSVFIKNK
jgi:voltage-gated potassium channel